MYSFKRHASQVVVRHSDDGWVRADYLGPLSAQAFAYLGALVGRKLAGAAGVIERLDQAVTLFNGDELRLEDLRYLQGTPAGAWVVQAGHYIDMLDLAQRVRQLGVTRYVVLPHQLGDVIDFVHFESSQSVS